MCVCNSGQAGARQAQQRLSTEGQHVAGDEQLVHSKGLGQSRYTIGALLSSFSLHGEMVCI